MDEVFEFCYGEVTVHVSIGFVPYCLIDFFFIMAIMVIIMIIIMVIIHGVHEFIPGEHAVVVRIEHLKCHFWSHLFVMVITVVITMVITVVVMVITVVSMISVSATAFFSDVLDIITCGIL